eukprot:NODE_3037_length_990_cov_16.145590_g17_i82.p1 GENE.NODE_3037_length_990_cov_16.145590_g17_i82~~NODE_3037_length_990_cov_16.145590_g17_i82.p1  ORF type:complete len:80 (+),score=6.61 NODE_3037_length_990_cov_16.145590_g17_i82:154-393(+)
MCHNCVFGGILCLPSFLLLFPTFSSNCSPVLAVFQCAVDCVAPAAFRLATLGSRGTHPDFARQALVWDSTRVTSLFNQG